MAAFWKSRAIRTLIGVALGLWLGGSPVSAGANDLAEIRDYDTVIKVKDGEATLQFKYNCFNSNPVNIPIAFASIIDPESQSRYRTVMLSVDGDGPDSSSQQLAPSYLVRCDGHNRTLKIKLRRWLAPDGTILPLESGTYLLQLTLTTRQLDESHPTPFDNVREPIEVILKD